MTKPRVRFAPSPTGYLHIGGARTALFNWLWARKMGGTFVLRIEDTDLARSTEESVQVILDGMQWLGLDWDEGPGVGGAHGPYFQMRRLPLYREFADRLIAAGHAYRCYATKEELDALRAQAEARGEKFFYPHLWRDKGPADWIEGAPYVVRFKAPRSGTTTYVDKVFGEVSTPNDTLQDFVLLRSDGVPLYNFGAVVDDYTMGINLVARGRDHMINTPPQILLYQALGAAVPEFAHLPMMLTPDGKKMSKRLGDQQGIDVPVEAYQRKGWLPDAVLNYIARFGWSHGDQEVFTRDELVAAFDWAHCGTMDGRYDTKKALWVSAEHLRREAPEKLAARTAPFLARRGLDVPADGAQLAAAIVPAKPRAQTLVDLADAVDFYFREPPADDPAAVTKFLTPAAAPHLDSLADALAAHDDWQQGALDAALKAWVEARGVTMKEVGQPVRVALSGRAQSPALHEVMAVLGRDVTVQRLRAAARKAAAVA